MAQFFVLTGSDVGRSFQVGHGATLGRNPSCTVPLRDRSISRQHAHLECDEEGRWWLLDDGSRNGLRTGGERSERVELCDNDEVTVGELVLRFRSDSPATATARKTAEAPKVVQSDASDASGDAAQISFGDEIELEGADEPLRPEDLGLTDVRPAPNVAQPAPARPRAPEVVTPRVAPDVSSAKPAPRSTRAPHTVAPAAVSGRAGSGQALQYHRVENRRGLFAADLEQLPGSVRAALIALVVLVAGAACYFAFRGTHFLRSQVAPVEDVLSEDG